MRGLIPEKAGERGKETERERERDLASHFNRLKKGKNGK